MRRVLDWIDELFGHDRQSVRILLVLISAPVLILAADWGYRELTESKCNTACQAEADRFINEYAPLSSPTPFNPNKFIDKVLTE